MIWIVVSVYIWAAVTSFLLMAMVNADGFHKMNGFKWIFGGILWPLVGVYVLWISMVTLWNMGWAGTPTKKG